MLTALPGNNTPRCECVQLCNVCVCIESENVFILNFDLSEALSLSLAPGVFHRFTSVQK